MLIVEDDPSAARLLDLVFSSEGYGTTIISTGAQALTRLEGPPTDLVLLDVMLPDVDGLSVLEALRGSEAWAGTPVVLLTALNSDEDVWRGWSSGADYYLTKPLDLELLRFTVTRLIAERAGDGRQFSC